MVSRKLVSSLDDVGETASWGVGGVRAVVRVVGEELVSECDLSDEGLGVSATSLREGSREGCGVYGNWEELLVRDVPRVLELVRALQFEYVGVTDTLRRRGCRKLRCSLSVRELMSGRLSIENG